MTRPEWHRWVAVSLLFVAAVVLAFAVVTPEKDLPPCLRHERVMTYLLVGKVMVPQWHEVCAERGK